MKITPFTLSDILKSDKFYEGIVEAGRLTEENVESSMGVYGDRRRFTITKPLKEYAESARSGTAYEVKGKGLYVPSNKSRIINLHFHPPSDIWKAIPSQRDLETEINDESTPIKFGNPNIGYCFNVVSMIGHKDSDEIMLLSTQLKTRRDDLGNLPNWVIGEIEKFVRKYGFDGAPDELVRTLNNSGYYRAALMRFKGREDYDKELRKLSDFELLLRVDLCERSKWMQIEDE